MTPSRIAAIAAIIVAAFALVFVGLRGGSSDRYTLIFEDAGGLIPGNLLKVNGITMGTVTDIGITKDLKAKVGIQVDDLGPLRKGTLAQIRATSLGGVANKYIALTLAPNNAPNLPDRAVLGTAQTRGIVGQDEFVNAFDADTRKGLQEIVKGNAEIVGGKNGAQDLATAIKNAPGTLSEGRKFAEQLDPDDHSLRDIIVNGAAISDALSKRSEQITRLTRNVGVASEAAAGNGTEIGETIARAPATLDQATAVLNDIPKTLDDVKALLTKADEVKGGVPETLNQLTDTLTSGESTIEALARALNKPGDNNDAADLLAAAPAVGKAAGDAAKSVPGGLAAATPLLAKGRAYTPDIVSAITGLGLISANYDAAGHYLRLSPVLNLFQSSGTGATQDLVPRDTFNNRLTGYQVTTNRCPGGASQATSDGSAPFTDSGKIVCNTNDALPGG